MAATRSSNMERKSALRKNASPPINSIFERKRRWIKVRKQFEGFAYDGANVRLEFVDPDGSGALPAVLTTRYFNGPGVDNIIAQENFAGSQFAQGTYWHMKNYLGSTTDLIAAAEDGGHQNHITYDSYGNVVSQTNASVGSRYMYTGREYDAETGLQYYRARYYDSSTGRFLSEDPVPMANLYSYVGANPVNFVDPSGEGRETYGGLRSLIPMMDTSTPTSAPQPKRSGPLQGYVQKSDRGFGMGGSCSAGASGAGGGGGGPLTGGVLDSGYGPNKRNPFLPRITMDQEPTLGMMFPMGGAFTTVRLWGAGSRASAGAGVAGGSGSSLITSVVASGKWKNQEKFFMTLPNSHANNLQNDDPTMLYEINDAAHDGNKLYLYKFGIGDAAGQRPTGQVSQLNARTSFVWRQGAPVPRYSWKQIYIFPNRIQARMAENTYITTFRAFGFPLPGNWND